MINQVKTSKKSAKNFWIKKTFSLKGSVILGVLERSFLCGAFGILISFLYLKKIPVAQPILGNVIPSIVLALLLVFRTNTAYERFWEGRKLWGSTVSTIRNLVWQIWIAVDEVEQGDRESKITTLRLLSAFAISKKLYLRYEPASEELQPWVSPSQYGILQNTPNMPLEIIRWIADELHQKYKRGLLTVSQLGDIQSLMNKLIDNVGGCERILKTPIPPAYVIHLNQLVLIYCLILPFQFVKDLGWWTGLFVTIVSFALFGIEEIGVEIENPFGYDMNDLPLDGICQLIQNNIEEFIHCESRIIPKTSQDTTRIIGG
ncbi:bestrophin family protein [Allocoleopsis franciscana]|uniref:Putative membrane protein n=1 Tax=Allocoleopsis franciscana PCC 7113 TaxID=1173027 RepID=K9WNF2_9CYAN|nr:bestrophin family ion channel [Allocoleopsis franciscana]AFZ21299.1 putative membrane protein [Allocoleopsis franciscana PCC 7113]